jgi:hypothetical protein
MVRYFMVFLPIRSGSSGCEGSLQLEAHFKSSATALFPSTAPVATSVTGPRIAGECLTTIRAMGVVGRGRVWAAVEVVVAVVCALGAAGLLLWLGGNDSWTLALLASKGAAKAALLGLAGLAAGLMWLRQRRNRSEDSEE